MKTTIIVSLAVAVSSFAARAAQQSALQDRTSLNPDWKFIRLEEKAKDADFSAVAVDDAAWEKVRLPHTAHIEPLIVNDQWQGICWYRKSFDVPAEADGKKVFIEFEGAMNHSQVWINGEKVADHQGGYLPVVIDATTAVKPGAANILAVRLDNTDNPITGPKPLKILDFNMYGGLYRDAWMTIKDKVHISNPVLANKVAGGGIFITTPKVSAEKSIVEVKTEVVNESDTAKEVSVVQSVKFDGQVVKEQKAEQVTLEPGKDFEFVDQFQIDGAKLWSPDEPNLYYLETKIMVAGTVVDEQKTRFGIREFSFDGLHLKINGKKTFLRGVNRHQEYPFIGYALSDNAQYRDAKKIKDAGFDYIRLSHYPQSPAFMDACDELGLVVVDAILGWQYYADTDEFRNYCYRSAAELIRRDRNHPCVLAWEVSLNETQMPIPFMEELHRIVHAEYPGKNVYSCGWMDDVYDIYLQARQHRIMHDEDRDKSKPYVVSEYGDWEYYSSNAGLNQHQLSKDERFETSSRQKREFGEKRLLQQAKNLQESHNDNYNTDAFADGYWVMFDYNRGYHDDLEASGVMDIFRLPKFSYDFYRSQRDPAQEKVLKIASYWTEDSPLDLKVYSNCDTVKLFLNDRLVAEQKPDSGPNTENLAHPPFTFAIDKFEKGVLRAVGLIDGAEVAEDVVKTPGEPAALTLRIDECGKPPQAGVNDVLFLYIEAVDANGTVVPNYSETVELKIDGDAEVMNVGPLQAEAGIATALVRFGKDGGAVEFSASAGDLKGGQLKLDVEN